MLAVAEKMGPWQFLLGNRAGAGPGYLLTVPLR